MVTIVTRAGKGTYLTHNEVDANFTNLKNAVEDASTAVFVPSAYGAVGDGVADDGDALAAMITAAGATGDTSKDTYAAKMSLGGGRFYINEGLDLTGLRAGHGVVFGDGTLEVDMTSGNVLDVTGSLRTIIQNLVVSTFGPNDSTNEGPAVGLLYQRPASGVVSGNHWCNNTTIKGIFSKAALVNYAAEACEYTGLFLQNQKRSLASSCLHIQRTTDAPGEEFLSEFSTNATGARSNIRISFSNVICARAYPTLWTITAISKANPGVFSYTKTAGAIAPTAGDIITFERVASTGDVSSTWGEMLSNRIWTVDTATPANSTSGTFTLVGVDTSGLTGTYDATSGIEVNYQTGPGIRIVHRDRVQFDHFYISTYGSHGIEIAYGGVEYRGLKLHGHVEGDAVAAWAKFVCGPAGDEVLEVYDLDVYEHTSHIHEDFFVTNATTGSVKLYNPKINIAAIRVISGPGEATETMRGNIFDDPSKYYLYNADIIIGDAGYMNLVDEFAYFSGRIHIVSTGEVIEVPGIARKEINFIHYYDEFDQWSLAPFWNTRLGTNGSCAIGLTSTSARGGRALLSSGADAAATFAANGAMLHGRAIFRADSAGIDIEFGCDPVATLTNMAYFIGLTDEDQALEFPAVLATGDVITPTADNFVGFLYDSAADPAQEFWHAVIRGSAGTTYKVNLNVVPSLFVAGSPTKFRIKIDMDGLAVFYINGVEVATSGVTAVATNVSLCPIAAIFSRSAVSRNFSVDHFQIWGGK